MSVYSLLQVVCRTPCMYCGHSTVLLFIVIALNNGSVHVVFLFSVLQLTFMYSQVLPWHSLTCSQSCGFYLHGERYLLMLAMDRCS